MKSQAYRMALLYDFYGDVLTPRQKEFYDLYYNEDLSLAEIAENNGITRQGVRDVIVRAEAILTDLEDKTGLIKRFHAMQKQLAGGGERRPGHSGAAALGTTTRSWRPRPARSWTWPSRWRRSDPWHLKD